MRSIPLFTIAVFLGLGTVAGAGPASAQGKPRCESRATAYDTTDVECSVSATGKPRRFRFKANFSGSHDDTMASIVTTLDGAPLACEKGSKTSLQGEDGDVSLECRFSITEKAGTSHLLGMTVSWRHAQYTSFELDPD
jgi:hypothetical protein